MDMFQTLYFAAIVINSLAYIQSILTRIRGKGVMRKGQEKILQYARKNDYSDGCLKVLSREDLTLRQLNSLLSLLYHCRDKDEKWVDIFTSIDDYELRRLITRYMINITAEELEQLSTREKICSYFISKRCDM